MPTLSGSTGTASGSVNISLANPANASFDSLTANNQFFSLTSWLTTAYISTLHAATATFTSLTSAALTVSGASSISTLNVSSSMVCGSTLSVTGSSVLTGTVTCPGGLTAAALTSTSLSSTSVACTNFNVDSGVLFVDSTNNRVGLNTTVPLYPTHGVGTAHQLGTLLISNTAAATATSVRAQIDLNEGTRVMTISNNGGSRMTLGATAVVGITGDLNISSGFGLQLNGSTALSGNTLGSVITGVASSAFSFPGSITTASGTCSGTWTTASLQATSATVGALTSSGDVNVIGAYQVGGTNVLNGTTLGTSVTTASLSSITPSGGLMTVTGQVHRSSIPVLHTQATGAQSIPQATDTALIFGANGIEGIGSPGITHSAGVFTNTSGRAMIVMVSYVATFAANAAGARVGYILHNGTRHGMFNNINVGTGEPFVNNGTGTLLLSVGDTFRIMVWQNSGGALNTFPAWNTPSCLVTVL